MLITITIIAVTKIERNIWSIVITKPRSKAILIKYVKLIRKALKTDAIPDNNTFSLSIILRIAPLLKPSADSNPNSLYLEFCNLTSRMMLIKRPIAKIRMDTIKNRRLRLLKVLYKAATSLEIFYTIYIFYFQHCVHRNNIIETYHIIANWITFFINDGFRDDWIQVGKWKGLTCCQGSDLLNAASSLNKRIDFILLKNG